MAKQIVEVSDGRIRWSANMSHESDLDEGFYIFDESHGITGDGPEEGPYATESEAEEKLAEMLADEMPAIEADES